MSITWRIRIFGIVLYICGSGWGVHGHGHFTHPEAAGNYTSSFFFHQTSHGPLSHLFATEHWNRFEQSTYGNHLTIMYPSRSFGVGVGVSYISRNIRFISKENVSETLNLNGWSDIRLIAKYRFGIYKKFSWFGRERLFKAAFSILTSLKLPTASTSAMSATGDTIPPTLQLGTGSSDFTFGFAMHTDTEKWFRIHAHITATFPLTYKSFYPGKSINFSILYTLVQFGINDRFYPVLGVKGNWHTNYRWKGKELNHSGGSQFVLASGIRSVWWYFHRPRMFLMSEVYYLLPIFDTLEAIHQFHSGFYLGLRMFLR